MLRDARGTVAVNSNRDSDGVKKGMPQNENLCNSPFLSIPHLSACFSGII